MCKTSVAVLAALVLSAPAAAGSGQRQAFVPILINATVQRDVVFVFASGLREGTRVTVGLMDNQKLKGEFRGVRDGRLLLRADRDRSITLPIAFSAIHSIKVHRGGSIERP